MGNSIVLAPGPTTYTSKLSNLHFLEVPKLRRTGKWCGSAVGDGPKDFIPYLYFPADPEGKGGITGTPRIDLNINHADKVILYLHGNSCDVGDMYVESKLMAQYTNSSVFVMEYPGYGVTQNVGHQALPQVIDAWASCLTSYILKTLRVPPNVFYIFGRSIGTGPACKLAAALHEARYKIGGLILQQPYIDLHTLADDYAAIGRYVIPNPWSPMKDIGKLRTTNLLIVHGENDEIIPVRHAEELLDGYRPDPNNNVVKMISTPPDMPHNEYYLIDDVMVPLEKFLNKTSTNQPSFIYCRPLSITTQVKKVPKVYSQNESTQGCLQLCSVVIDDHLDAEQGISISSTYVAKTSSDTMYVDIDNTSNNTADMI